MFLGAHQGMNENPSENETSIKTTTVKKKNGPRQNGQMGEKLTCTRFIYTEKGGQFENVSSISISSKIFPSAHKLHVIVACNCGKNV